MPEKPLALPDMETFSSLFSDFTGKAQRYDCVLVNCVAFSALLRPVFFFLFVCLRLFNTHTAPFQ